MIHRMIRRRQSRPIRLSHQARPSPSTMTRLRELARSHRRHGEPSSYRPLRNVAARTTDAFLPTRPGMLCISSSQAEPVVVSLSTHHSSHGDDPLDAWRSAGRAGGVAAALPIACRSLRVHCRDNSSMESNSQLVFLQFLDFLGRLRFCNSLEPSPHAKLTQPLWVVLSTAEL